MATFHLNPARCPNGTHDFPTPRRVTRFNIYRAGQTGTVSITNTDTGDVFNFPSGIDGCNENPTRSWTSTKSQTGGTLHDPVILQHFTVAGLPADPEACVIISWVED